MTQASASPSPLAVDSAIARFRRDLALAAALRWALLFAAAAAIILQSSAIAGGIAWTLALVIIGAIWLLLSYRSVRGSRIAAAAPVLIALGQYDQAEEHISRALNSFSLFKGVKLRGLHHLAVLRHAQGRHAEAAALGRAVLQQYPGAGNHLVRSARLLVAESVLETGDLAAAYEALMGLYTERLSLAEALELTLVQLDYLSRVGAWRDMLHGLPQKVELIELLEAPRAARAQGLFALAARKQNKKEWEHWLRRRAELLSTPEDLIKARPLLRELWEPSK